MQLSRLRPKITTALESYVFGQATKRSLGRLLAISVSGHDLPRGPLCAKGVPTSEQSERGGHDRGLLASQHGCQLHLSGLIRNAAGAGAGRAGPKSEAQQAGRKRIPEI